MAPLRRRSEPEKTSCFCRVDGAPFSTARFWEVRRYPWSRNARRRRAGSSGRTRQRARQYKTAERRKPGYSIAWRTLAADQVRIAESAELPNTRKKLSSCAPRSAGQPLRHFDRVQSYKERCCPSSSVFGPGGLGPGVLVREQRPLATTTRRSGTARSFCKQTGRVSSPAAHWIGCSMSGAAGPLSACLHRRDSTRCDHAAAAAATDSYPL